MSSGMVGQLTKCEDFQGFTRWTGIVHFPGKPATRENFKAAETRGEVWAWLCSRLPRGAAVDEWSSRTFRSQIRRVP